MGYGDSVDVKGTHQQLSAATLASAVGLSNIPTVPATNTLIVYMQATGNNGNIRFTVDGSTNPTASKGMVLYAGAGPTPWSGPLANLKFILESGSPTLDYCYVIE